MNEDSLSLSTWTASATQATAAHLLGRGKTRLEVAAACKVHRNTVANWCDIPGFQELVMASNREWRAEFDAMASRIVHRSLEIEERSLSEDGPLDEYGRAKLAHEIVLKSQLT